MQIRVGLKGLVVAKVLTDVYGGSTTYDTIVSLPGAVVAGLKPVGSIDKFYSDDSISAVNEVYVGGELDLQVANLTQSDKALLLGHTYAVGGVLKTAGDTSPYFAVGFQVKYDDGTYKYTWLFKVKFKKTDENAETLKESTTWQPYSLSGVAIPLSSNGQIEYSMTNNDPAYDTTKWANFFATVTTSSTDNTALTATIAKGTAGDAGKILFTFVKGSSGTFSIAAALVTASTIQITDAVGFRAGTYAVGGAGTSVVIKFTPTVAFATETVGAAVTNDIKDSFGVAATPTGLTLTYV